MSLNSSEGPADRPGSGSDTEEACPFDDNHSHCDDDDDLYIMLMRGGVCKSRKSSLSISVTYDDDTSGA